MRRHYLQCALKTLHEAVVLFEPHAEALQLDEYAERVETDGLSNGEFAVHFRKTLFASELLPLVHAVRA